MIRHTLRYELRTLGRNGRARVFTLAFPVLLLVVLSGIGGDTMTTAGGRPVTLERFFLPGVLTMSIVTACFASLVMVVVTRRQLGVYQRRRATPVPASALVVAQTVATTTLAAASAVLLLVVARLAFGIGIEAGALGAIALTFVLGALCCSAVAFALATALPSPETAQPVVQFVMFPILFVSGIWFPSDDMPAWLNAIADAFPVAHLSSALHQAVEASSFGDALAGGHLAVLGAWTAGAAVLASRRFSWLPSTATA